jgi:hypothetical protein
MAQNVFQCRDVTVNGIKVRSFAKVPKQPNGIVEEACTFRIGHAVEPTE